MSPETLGRGKKGEKQIPLKSIMYYLGHFDEFMALPTEKQKAILDEARVNVLSVATDMPNPDGDGSDSGSKGKGRKKKKV